MRLLLALAALDQYASTSKVQPRRMPLLSRSGQARPWARAPRHGLRMSATPPSPDEWRAFRAKLVAGGLPGTQDTEQSDPQERRQVAPANEELLSKQNKDLYKEYLEGAWAHAAALPEAGGLMLRRPFSVELVQEMEASDPSYWARKLRERLEEEVPEGDEEERRRLTEQFKANPAYMYRLAETLVANGLKELPAPEIGDDGQISPGFERITPETRELLVKYATAQDAWQEVLLVLEADGVSNVAQSAVVINRPLARSCNVQTAQRLLNGAGAQASATDQFIVSFLEAFGEDCAIYLGGPDDTDQPALLVHGLDLPGTKEVAPGTRIFTGGVEAAVKAVLDDIASPLDFRWIIGRRRDVASGPQWMPCACARPVALKQCLGLPKPLFHEVLELCGGPNAALSRMELIKRPDIDFEEGSNS